VTGRNGAPPLDPPPMPSAIGSPQPRLAPFTSQTTAAQGSIVPMVSASANDADLQSGPTKPADTQGPALGTTETSRPSAKVPAPPGNELDPPPMPVSAARTPGSSDPSLPPPVPSVVKPSPAPTAAGDSLEQLRAIYKKAADRYASMDSYIARFKRREQINGKDKPEELMLFKFRKKPYSVYFKWLGIEGKNRECVYVRGRNGNLIHTLLAEGDVPFMPAGKRFSISPDSALVRGRTRYPISEAGIGVIIDRFGRMIDAADRGNYRYGKVKYLGELRRPEFEKPQLVVEQAIPPGAEALLPKGGSRLWIFDPDSGLPVLLITNDHANREVEYYCYDQILFPVKLDDDDFNPDKLWRR
jgi:uncharacterized protein DUF1571